MGDGEGWQLTLVGMVVTLAFAAVMVLQATPDAKCPKQDSKKRDGGPKISKLAMQDDFD